MLILLTADLLMPDTSLPSHTAELGMWLAMPVAFHLPVECRLQFDVDGDGLMSFWVSAITCCFRLPQHSMCDP